ncbi:MAG: IS630 family transposase [Myxococcales bacterium]|nr:IS630 family transposase [Myxococcales bacterium]
MRIAKSITLTSEERKHLQAWSRGSTTAYRLVLRARMILLAAEGKENKEIAAQLGCNVKTVGQWRNRFIEEGVESLKRDRPRGHPKPTVLGTAVEDEIVRKTTQERPEQGTHWSTRTMAKAVGVSDRSVRRVWKRYGLKPHLQRTFKLSHDPAFSEKLENIVGLYMNPPEHALVLSVDEKSQIQALDRTQPGLPLKPGRCGTRTHDYKRNGTTTLFAALCTLTSHIISECMPRHRHQEWLAFLKRIKQEVPKNLDIHIVCDNYSTHKHETVRAWLAKNPRFHMHFTPTSASWLNLVERFFRDLTEKRIRRGVFKSIDALHQSISTYIEHYNNEPKPFIWTAKAEDILTKVLRARKALDCS